MWAVDDGNYFLHTIRSFDQGLSTLRYMNKARVQTKISIIITLWIAFSKPLPAMAFFMMIRSGLLRLSEK